MKLKRKEINILCEAIQVLTDHLDHEKEFSTSYALMSDSLTALSDLLDFIEEEKESVEDTRDIMDIADEAYTLQKDKRWEEEA